MAHDLPYVRIATPEDEEAVVAMVRRLHAESALFGLNEAKIRAHLHRCFNKDGMIVGVIGDPGRLEASTCMCISSYHYTDDWHLEEFWNFVEEPFRKGTRNAEALIEFNKACAVKMGIPLVIGVLANKQMAAKVRLYRRLLGYPTGAFFCFNSKWEADPVDNYDSLRHQLREWAQKCNDRRITADVARKKIGSLLRDAAKALSHEDDVWSKPMKLNGADHSEGP